MYCPKKGNNGKSFWRPFLHAFKHDRIESGDQEEKKARVVNRNESYVPPLYVGVCG